MLRNPLETPWSEPDEVVTERTQQERKKLERRNDNCSRCF